jgi:hypothetical protein
MIANAYHAPMVPRVLQMYRLRLHTCIAAKQIDRGLKQKIIYLNECPQVHKSDTMLYTTTFSS